MNYQNRCSCYLTNGRCDICDPIEEIDERIQEFCGHCDKATSHAYWALDRCNGCGITYMEDEIRERIIHDIKKGDLLTGEGNLTRLVKFLIIEHGWGDLGFSQSDGGLKSLWSTIKVLCDKEGLQYPEDNRKKK